MIILSILFLLLSNAVTLRRDTSIIFNRIAILALIYCIAQDLLSLYIINKGIGLHGGLLHISYITQIFHIFIFIISLFFVLNKLISSNDYYYSNLIFDYSVTP